MGPQLTKQSFGYSVLTGNIRTTLSPDSKKKGSSNSRCPTSRKAKSNNGA
jgi:hypothetical protein